MRTATVKKNKAYKFGQSLAKGEEVKIEETPIGNGKVKFTAYKTKGDLNIGFGITASEFEYTEEVEFKVSVCRTSYAHREIVVKAKTRKEAETLAIDEAGSHEFSEKDADYTVNFVTENK